MGLKEDLTLEIERETASTTRLLAHIKDEHLGYKPHEKSMSLGQLAGHIVELHNWVNKGLHTSELDLATNYVPLVPSTVEELSITLEAGKTQNIDFVRNATEDELNSLWTLKFGDHVISTLPKSAAFRYIIYNHLIHHRGQLTVYLRLLDIPIPGLYGPSADEQMPA